MSLRVCFLSYHAYPVIEPSVREGFGGTETRAWLLARGLARADDEMDVSFLVRTRRPLVRDEYDEVRVIRRRAPLWWIRYSVSCHVDRLPRFPWLRIRHWTPSLLWKIPLLAAAFPFRKGRDPLDPDPYFKRFEADAFCLFGVHRDAATVIASARATGRKTLLFLGADSDLDERFTADSNYRTPYGEYGYVCRYSLDHADRIVVQTPWQQEALRERFGRDGVLLANPIDLADWQAAQGGDEDLPEAQGLDRYVLWVGRADTYHKRPLLALDVARRCPDVEFLMILNPRHPEVEEQVRRELPPNVRIVERVPLNRMPLVFRRAAIYLNTSKQGFEGFPNVFLQAAASRVPIASLEFDRDFVAPQQCGLVADGDVDRLAEYVRSVWSDPRRGREEGDRGFAYAGEHHDLEAKAAQLADLLRETLGRPGASLPRPE